MKQLSHPKTELIPFDPEKEAVNFKAMKFNKAI